MRGVGGPLLCIGDLLSDVGDDEGGSHHDSPTLPSSPSIRSHDHLDPSDLLRLFEESYKELIESLSGDDHSWTALTLKLCAAIKSADNLVMSANSNVESLLQKVEHLESIIKRGDDAVAKAMRAIQRTDN